MRRSLVWILVVPVLATAAMAFAQGKRAPARPGKPAAAAAKPPAGAVKGGSDNPYEDAKPAPKSVASAAPADPAGAASSASATPPAAALVAPGDAGVRSSPLDPRPEELSDAGSPAPPPDYDRILGDIAALRARVAAVGDTLFKSKLALRVETRGDHAKVSRLVVMLDDGVVYTAPASFRAEDETTIYEHAVAPGRHVLGVEVERKDDRGDGFRAGQTSRVVLDVPENQRLEATIRLDDDSDMAADFPSSQQGRYDLRVRVRAKVKR